MSHRIVLEGYVSIHHPDQPVSAWADQVVPIFATNAEVDRVAAEWRWRLPLRIFTPDVKDPRFLRLVRKLSEHMQEPGTYRVFSSGFVEEDVTAESLGLED